MSLLSDQGFGAPVTVYQTPLPAPPASTGASALVTQGFASAQLYAANAFNAATTFLTNIQGVAANLQTIPSVSGSLTPIASAVAAYVAPALPIEPTGLTMNLPAVPTAPTLASVALLNTGAPPVFTAVPLPIDLTFAAPVPLTTSVPLAPTLPAVVIPSAPTITLPDVPSLVAINIPTEPLLNLPTFTAVQPSSPLAPGFIFSFAEPTYSSTLLTDLRARLLEWVDGTTTGILPAVEQAIWDRGRSRENTAAGRKMKESVRSYAARGFTKPPGALSVEIASALQDTQDTLSAQSREVMIKQADLEQSNRRFAFEQAWKVEEGLITYQNQIAQRAFDTAKYAQQVMIDIFHEVVLRYTADIQAYVAQVEVFKATITAELAKLDLFKAEIEAQKLIGEINTQAIEIYRARIDGVKAVIDIFKAQVDAANTAALVNKTQIEGFAAQVGAYAETVRAKAAEYEGYATRVRAEVSKIDVFKAEADAYSSQVGGFKALVDAQVASKNIEIKVGQEVPLDIFKSLTDVYRTTVSAESERVNAVTKVYEARAQVYGAEVQGETARVNASVETVKSQTSIAVAEGNLRIEAAKANVQALIQQTTVLVDAIKAGAQVAAQLAASALSAVNLSGQIGDHSSYSVGFSNSNSASNSSSQSVGYTASIGTSVTTANQTTHSDQTINSTSNNTNANYNYTP
jgi:hypothetical protein